MMNLSYLSAIWNRSILHRKTGQKYNNLGSPILQANCSKLMSIRMGLARTPLALFEFIFGPLPHFFMFTKNWQSFCCWRAGNTSNKALFQVQFIVFESFREQMWNKFSLCIVLPAFNSCCSSTIGNFLLQ